MKKLLLTLVFISLFLGCEKEEIKPDPDFFIGEWVSYIPSDEKITDVLNVNFKILNINEIECYAYLLEDYEFDENELKISFKIHTDLFSTIRYYATYDTGKNMFIGNSCYYKIIPIFKDNTEHCVYFHKNVLTIRK